jgi:formate/nitrite transporter FocA (FNT family)
MPEQDEPPVETRWLTVYQILRAAAENAREEIKRSPRTQAFSGLAGGLTMGLTGLGVASVRALIGEGQWQQFIFYFIYPVGFMAVIIGRAQRFTENTLYPVILVLEERRHFTQIFRLVENRIQLERGGSIPCRPLGHRASGPTARNRGATGETRP